MFFFFSGVTSSVLSRRLSEPAGLGASFPLWMVGEVEEIAALSG
jgi:hypothetical protein